MSLRDELQAALEWLDAGESPALAMILETNGSSPREVGTIMFVRADGATIGSLSGGCVESDVVERAGIAVRDGRGVVVSYGPISDDDPLAVGLPCGGKMTVGIVPLGAERDVIARLCQHLDSDRPACLVLGLDESGSSVAGVVTEEGSAEGAGLRLPATVVVDARRFMTSSAEIQTRSFPGMSAARRSREFMQKGSWVYRAVVPPAPMFIIGTSAFVPALAELGRTIGYRTVLVDAGMDLPSMRAEMTPASVVCVMSHDLERDVRTCATALESSAGYIGVMGSRESQSKLMARLLEQGFTENDLLRLKGPIGLDLGARTPEEVAVAIAAEILAFRNARSAQPLSAVEGPIHSEAEKVVPAHSDTLNA